MSRRVRSGMFDQRDRATKRRRDRPSPPAEPPDPHLVLRAEIQALESTLDLETYLRRTNAIALEPAERLRILAIEQEHAVPFETLRRIYAKAVALAPETAWNHASFGISAGEYASVEPDEPAAARLWALAHAELELAAQLDPDDASIAAAQGYAAYMDGACAREDTLRALDRAIALDPRQPWASLYRAHVLHDLERWSEAAQAYDRVPKDAFDGPRSWRMDLLVEQRAFCSLRAGDLRGAREGFERILARYEVQPHLAQWGQLVYLSKAADEALPELRERVDALARRLDAS